MHILYQTCAAADVACTQQTIYAVRWRSYPPLPAINNPRALKGSCRPDGLCNIGTVEGVSPAGGASCV